MVELMCTRGSFRLVVLHSCGIPRRHRAKAVFLYGSDLYMPQYTVRVCDGCHQGYIRVPFRRLRHHPVLIVRYPISIYSCNSYPDGIRSRLPALVQADGVS